MLLLGVRPSTTWRSCNGWSIAGASPRHGHEHRDRGQEEAGLVGLHVSRHPAAWHTLKQSRLCSQKQWFARISWVRWDCSLLAILLPLGIKTPPGQAAQGHEDPSCGTGFHKQRGCLSSAASGAFDEDIALHETCAAANTRHTHFTGESPREQNWLLWSDESRQISCQPAWGPAVAAGGQKVSSGALQVYAADMSIWGESLNFALEPQRDNWPLTLWWKKKADNSILRAKDECKATCIRTRRTPEDIPIIKIISQLRAVGAGRITRGYNPNYQLAGTMT